MPLVTALEWDTYLKHFPDAHLLQTSAWGEFKSEYGWNVSRLIGENGAWGAQILFRRLPLGFSIAYMPRGPLCTGITPGAVYSASKKHWFNEDASFLRELDDVCRSRRAILLKIEPDAHSTQIEPPPDGFRHSIHTIQPPRTLVVSLIGDEKVWLARMKQKTRYNIRLAQKRGVIVRSSQDLDVFYRLMQVTGNRDAFGVHSRDYYQKVYDLYAPSGQSQLFLAEFEEKPIAALMVFRHGRRAWYFYGASADESRELMPTYLLQYEAMRWAQQNGCTEYDLWGVPDEDEETLEANFLQRSDGLWGVYRFKRGFGGELLRSVGPWDRVYNPIFYVSYNWYMMRKGETG